MNSFRPLPANPHELVEEEKSLHQATELMKKRHVGPWNKRHIIVTKINYILYGGDLIIH